MSNTPMPKRRRVSGYNVNKPFKSPIRTPGRVDMSILEPSPLRQTVTEYDIETPVTDQTPASSFASSSNASSSQTASSSSPHITSASLPAPSKSLKPFVARRKQPQTMSKEAQQNRQLERAILQARQDIDTLSQAISITTKDADTNLQELEMKWRTAARLAAEELFASAKEKVCRMGGVGGWKDREQEQRDREMERRRDEIEERKREYQAMIDAADDDDEEDEEERADGEPKEKRYREKWEYDDREAEFCEEDLVMPEMPAETQPLDQYEDDDGFTMDMMLRSLGIDPKLIGYSKERQTWIG